MWQVRWARGTLACFDNFALLHAGTPPGPALDATRMLHRISKVGRLAPAPAAAAARL